MENSVELIPASVFLNELKHENFKIRLNCVTRLKAVALAVGTEEFREKIVPDLIDLLRDDESLLAILAERLGELLAYVGGTKSLLQLLKPLEQLVICDNIEVQRRAVASMNNLVQYCNDDELKTCYFPMVTRMANESHNIVCKLSSCQLLIKLYERSPEDLRPDLRRLVVRFGIDANPLVRKEIAYGIPSLARVMHKVSVRDLLLPLHRFLCGDALEFVKVAALGSTPSITEKLISSVRDEYIIGVIKDAINSTSTELRKVILGQLPEFMGLFHSEETRNFLISGFFKLVFDCDPEIKSHAVILIEEFLRQLTTSERLFLTQNLIIPDIHLLLNDEVMVVRKSLASVVCSLATILPKERLPTDLYPVIQKLFKDSSEKVRSEIALNFYKLDKVVDIEEIQKRFLPLLLVLAGDSKWTVRLASISFHTRLAITMGFSYFNSDYHVTFLKWMTDHVFVIREKCILSLCELIKKFGHQSQVTFLPKVVGLMKNPNYLIRISCVNLFSVLSPYCNKEMNVEVILPALVKLTHDSVANVRLNVAKAFKAITPQLDDRFIALSMRPSLLEIINDKDRDVRFFAAETLEYIGSNISASSKSTAQSSTFQQ